MLEKWQKEFIKKNCVKMSDGEISQKIGASVESIRYYRYSCGILKKPPLKEGKKPITKCSPPYECFECSLPDCIRFAPISAEETKFLAVGMSGTKGRRE